MTDEELEIVTAKYQAFFPNFDKKYIKSKYESWSPVIQNNFLHKTIEELAEIYQLVISNPVEQKTVVYRIINTDKEMYLVGKE